MPSFYITADSGCDLTKEFCQSLDVIPIHVRYSIDDKSYDDAMTTEGILEFYEKMRSGQQPRTTQLNMHDFIELWTPLMADSKPIVHIAMSSGLSGTYNNAMQAREMMLEQYPSAEIYVIDSLITSLGSGAFVIKAAEMRDNGATAAQTAQWISANASKMHAIFATSDLTYMFRGGRVSRLGMTVVHALGIWPILHVSPEGSLKVFEKARGKAATFSKIVKVISELVVDPKEQTLYVSHSDSLEDAEQLAEQIKTSFGFKDVFFSYIGCVVGAHTGPGLVSVFFFGKER